MYSFFWKKSLNWNVGKKNTFLVPLCTTPEWSGAPVSRDRVGGAERSRAVSQWPTAGRKRRWRQRQQQTLWHPRQIAAASNRVPSRGDASLSASPSSYLSQSPPCPCEQRRRQQPDSRNIRRMHRVQVRRSRWNSTELGASLWGVCFNKHRSTFVLFDKKFLILD
jgi:hypothetical protein